jgi:hypothetical protein
MIKPNQAASVPLAGRPSWGVHSRIASDLPILFVSAESGQEQFLAGR